MTSAEAAIATIVGALVPHLHWADPPPRRGGGPRGSCVQQMTRMVISIVAVMAANIVVPGSASVALKMIGGFLTSGATSAGLQGIAHGARRLG